LNKIIVLDTIYLVCSWFWQHSDVFVWSSGSTLLHV